MTINMAIITAFLVALATISLDTILGILVSFKAGTFDVGKLPQFIRTNILPYIGGLIILALLANYVNELEYYFYTGVGLVAIKFSKEAILDKLRSLFS